MKESLVFFSVLAASLGFSDIASAENWNERKTDHFIIYFKSSSGRLIDQVALEAEKQFQSIADAFGLWPYPAWWADERAKIYIYDRSEEYHASSAETHGIAWSAGYADPGKWEIRTFDQGIRNFLDRILPHELAHLLMYHHVGLQADVPAWFSEGMAQLAENLGHGGSEAFVRRQIERNGYVSLDGLTDDSRVREPNFYDISLSAVRYLESVIRDKFRMFLDALKQGDSFDAALRNASNGYFQSTQDFNDRWVAHVKNSG